MSPEKKRLKALLYGDSGTRKTRSVLTIPPEMKVLLLDIDDGTLSLGSSLPPNITVVKFYDTPPSPKDEKVNTGPFLHAFHKLRSQLLGELVSPKHDVVFVDSLTALSNAVLRQIAFDHKDDYYVPQIQDWGSYVSDFRNICNMLSNPRVHVLFIAHEDEVMKTTGVGKEEVDKIRPFIHTKFSKQLGRFFDEEYRSTNRGNKTMWRTQGNQTIEAKSRLGLPLEVEMGWGQVFEKLRSEFNGAVPEKKGEGK